MKDLCTECGHIGCHAKDCEYLAREATADRWFHMRRTAPGDDLTPTEEGGKFDV